MTEFEFRIRKQLEEALGPVNQWYCSQAYGYCVIDPNLLIKYFVKSRGAEDFSKRFDEAMGQVNRWYCSQKHGCDIRDREILWNYYMKFGGFSSEDDGFCIAC